jgi:hypothetical protein
MQRHRFHSAGTKHHRSRPSTDQHCRFQRPARLHHTPARPYTRSTINTTTTRSDTANTQYNCHNPTLSLSLSPVSSARVMDRRRDQVQMGDHRPLPGLRTERVWERCTRTLCRCSAGHACVDGGSASTEWWAACGRLARRTAWWTDETAVAVSSNVVGVLFLIKPTWLRPR